eukprot:CAMPEP_0195289620 /NCGR_PEP_ID=MMETSP0707-20130614/5820_1 /TAXON_ID=33640 /ORGANISM="Asterionellopsis glacialis, Strain CCMP134" /LENGTH=715 /DNA_ID=CAMNT_0040349643 /DNA_START=131 /DNA_END=2278 /DNA_ORIENTATION=+
MDKLPTVATARRYASLNSPNRKKSSSFRKMKQIFSRNRKHTKNTGSSSISTSTGTSIKEGSSKSLKASLLFPQEEEEDEEHVPDLQMSFHSSYTARSTVEEDEPPQQQQSHQIFGESFYNAADEKPDTTTTTTTTLDSIQESLSSSGFPVETVEFPRIPMNDNEEEEDIHHHGNNHHRTILVPPFSPKKNTVVLFSPTPQDPQQQQHQHHEGSQQTDSLTTDDYSSSADDYLASPPSVRLRSDSPSSSLTDEEEGEEEEEDHCAIQQVTPQKPCREDNHHTNKAELIHVSKNLLTDFDDLAAMVEAEAAAAAATKQQQPPRLANDEEDSMLPSSSSSSSRYTQHVLLMEYESQRQSKQHQRYKALRHEWKIYVGFLQRRYKKLYKGEQFVSSKRFSTIPHDYQTRGQQVVQSTLKDAKRLGDQLKTQLQHMEDQVHQTWSFYENLITSYTNNSHDDEDQQHHHPHHPICEDEWMLEYQYCTHVQQQLNLWNTTLSELSTMFHLVRHELSMYQEELFVLFEKEKISKSIAFAYLGAEQRPEEDNHHNRCIFSDLKNNTDDDSPTTTSNSNVVPMSPPSPLKSSLLKSCQVMERRTDHGWTSTVAIVTADSVVHFFDSPNSEDPSKSTTTSSFSPQDIMEELLVVSSSTPKPNLSIYLPNCSPCHKVRTIHSTYDEDLEIIEAYLDPDRCFTTRKTLLRTTSSKEIMEWSHNVFVTC